MTTTIPSRDALSERIKDVKRTADEWKRAEALLVAYADRVRRAADGPADVIDGFPKSTMGGGGGGASVKVDADEHGGEERIPITSVEGAAMALMDGRQRRDKTAGIVHEALRHLSDADHAIDGIFRMVELLGRLDDAPVTKKRCEACMAAGIERLPDHWGCVGGRLGHNADLCDAHYDYVLKFGRLPSVDQTRQHERTGRWRVAA